jgi:hypothetical protein
MSRINLTIDRIVLRGVDPGDQTGLLEGLQKELSRVLRDVVRHWTVRAAPLLLKLGTMPVTPGTSGGQVLGARVGGAIGKGLKP